MKSSIGCFFLIPVSVITLLGCGGDGIPDVPRGTVTGKVTFDGGPIPEGSSIVFSSDGGTGIPASSSVGSDGSFRLRAKNSFDIPTGIYQISISPPTPKQMTEEDAMDASIKGTISDIQFKEIPNEYRNPVTSGETFEVKEGENTYTLDMKPK